MVYYLHADHLGSSSLATCGNTGGCNGTANGAEIPNSRTLYYPYGEVRWPSGGSTLPTDFTFTGQRNEAGIGLMDYHARFYDPALGRFVQADSIVSSPGNPQSLNRYSYCLGNPLVYVDPSGHWFKPPPTLGPRQEFEVIDWPVALKLTTMAMCVAAPNCYIETQGHKGYSESDIDSGSFGTMYVPYTTTSVKTIWNDPEQWADYLIKSSLPVAEWAIAPELGALRPAARGLAAAEEGILLTEAQGLQTRTAGLFDDVILGTHGDDATRYLWTIDNRGVNLAFEHTTFPTPRGYLVHSNLSSEAYFAGEAWFVGPNEVVINAGSGRWGDRSGVTQAMWDAAIRIWEGLGYIVRTLPLGER